MSILLPKISLFALSSSSRASVPSAAATLKAVSVHRPAIISR